VASLSLAFDILARDKNASRTFDKVGRSAETAGKRGKAFGSLMSGAAKIAAGALAAAGIAELMGKVTDVLGDSIAEAREAQKVGKTTGAIIKATGGAAKISQKQVEGLAESLSVKAGVDDEVIQSGANLLLTFKNVRNEAGKGAKIFDRATTAAVDLSAAGFGSVEGASKMLGKALNDPVKGISALGRAGVTFTAGQKKQIKTLMESGKTLEAQKIILGEVESQVGGVAAANASMGDKVKVAWGNIKEELGTALLPILDRLGRWFLEKGIPALRQFAAWAGENILPPLKRLGAWFMNTGLPAIQRFGGWITDKLWPALKQGYETIMPGLKQALDLVKGGLGEGGTGGAFRKLGDILVTKVIPFVSKFMSYYLPYLGLQIRIVIEIVKKLWAAFTTLMGVVGKVISFILKRFADLSSMWAGVLRALAKVPGFGWAKDAAAKLETAAGKANGLAAAIDSIDRNVDVKVKVSGSGQVTLPGGTKVDFGQYRADKDRHTGGPVHPGTLYQVGDNPDGSWNSTTEVLSPRRPMHVLNQDQMAKQLGTGGGGGRTDLSESSIQRLVAAIQSVTLRPTISAGSVDAAVGGTLR
jgi:phage-related protein